MANEILRFWWNFDFQYPKGPITYPVSIENVIAIPSDSFATTDDLDKYLSPDATDRTGDFATECVKESLQVNPSDPGKTRWAQTLRLLNYLFCLNISMNYTSFLSIFRILSELVDFNCCRFQWWRLGLWLQSPWSFRVHFMYTLTTHTFFIVKLS